MDIEVVYRDKHSMIEKHTKSGRSVFYILDKGWIFWSYRGDADEFSNPGYINEYSSLENAMRNLRAV